MKTIYTKEFIDRMVDMCVNQCMTTTKAAKTFGCRTSTVWAALRLAHVKLRRDRTKKILSDENMEELKRLYVEERKTTDDIVKLTGHTAYAIRKALKNKNVKMREPGRKYGPGSICRFKSEKMEAIRRLRPTGRYSLVRCVILQLYVDEGKTVDQIHAEVGYSIGFIWNMLCLFHPKYSEEYKKLSEYKLNSLQMQEKAVKRQVLQKELTHRRELLKSKFFSY